MKWICLLCQTVFLEQYLLFIFLKQKYVSMVKAWNNYDNARLLSKPIVNSTGKRTEK